MKNYFSRIFLTGTLCFVFLLCIPTSVFAVWVTLPVPNSPTNQRDNYKTDLFTGSATYSYPFRLPKGTDNLSPDISLSYNSSGLKDYTQNSGAGWQLSQDYIERDVNFTPTDTSDDKYKLHFQGKTDDLIYVSSENKYHTKVESFLRIEKLSSGGQNTNGEYWIVTTKDGTKYRFGYADNSELVCEGRSYVLRWNIDEVTDIHNNHIYFTYNESNGVSYPSKIEYNTDKTRIVNFTYATNPFQRQIYRQGCNTKEVSRLSTIQVKINTTLVRQYDLNYTQATNTQQLVQSITEKGSDGTSLPATTLEYKPEIHSWPTAYVDWINNTDVDANIDMVNVRLIDVNGDGLPDLVKNVNNGGPNNDWQVRLNNGSTWASQWSSWANPIDANFTSGEVILADVTGDSLPDIVRSVNNGGPNNQWRVFRNTGSGWNTTYEVWAAAIDANNGYGWSRLMDANGDGYTDIVKPINNGGPNNQWVVWKNTGSGWNAQPDTWVNSIDANFFNLDTTLVDVNGDNLPDIIRSVNNGGPNNEWRVFKNTGSGWSTSYEVWAAAIDANIGYGSSSLIDVNGDGLTDIVKTINNGGPNNQWVVYLNIGNGWNSQPTTWVGAIDVNISYGGGALADVNGDGLTDIVRSINNGGPMNTWRVWKNNGYASNLLSAVHTPQGGLISFDYTPSTTFDNTGVDSNPDLPFTLWLVNKMTVNNGMTNSHNTNDITTYSYQDGFYKWQDRDFRGFATIDETLPTTAKKKYVFKQDDALKGLLQEVQTRSMQNNPFAEEENTWSSTSANGIYNVKLDQQKNYTFDGTATNPKIVETDYLYDNYGNISKKSELGDTSTSGDDRFTYNEYIYNTTLWIVNTPKHTYRNASNDTTKVSESWFYYDGHTGFDDTLTKGDLTKEVKWLDGFLATNPVTTYTYDSFGNQTSVTDANGHTRTTTYGTSDTTRTYPDSTTNAKNQTTATLYDLGTGNLLSKTDPNGFATTYAYDVFGRITKEIQPYDSSANPTTSYQYFFDGTAPEGTLVSKREVSNAAGTLDTYTFIDGLGRKLQTRSDAEDTSKQIVVNTFYAPSGEVLKETVPHLDTLGSSYAAPVSGIKTTEYTYDLLERITNIKNPKGDNKSVAYDHWKETTTDENGHTKRVFKNAFDKINKVEEVNGANTYATTYTYDARDLLTKITDAANNNTTFVYDSLGRKTSQTDSDMGTWSYEYDNVGNLKKQTDNRNIAVTKTYDEIDRLTKSDFPTDTDTTYLYDLNGKKGTLSIATDSAGTVNFAYDNRLRKTQEQRTVNGTTKTTQFTYDAADRNVTQTNPDGEVITSTFNTQGEVNAVGGVVSNIDYNAFGKITKKDFANGLTTNYTYNTTDFRLNRIQTGTLQDLNYTYDNVGNIASINDAVTSKTQNFTYDDLDRLKTAKESGGGSNQAYTYNAIGNLTNLVKDGVSTDNNYGQNAGVHALTSSAEIANLKTSSITDNWSTGSINGAKWNNWGSPQTTVQLGQLRINSTLGGGYYGIDTNAGITRDFTGSFVSNQVVNAGNQSLSSWGVFPVVVNKTGGNNSLFWAIEVNVIKAYKNVNGTTSTVQQAAYNSSVQKFFKIRESGGTVYWDYSTDGATWTNFASQTNPFDITSVSVGVNAGTWTTEESTTYALFDNFNMVPTVPSTASFSDDWSGGTINDSKWSNWGNPQTSIVSNQLKINSTTGGGYYGVDSATSGDFDFRGSFISNQVVSAGNQALNSWGVYPVKIDKSGSSNNGMYWAIEINKIRAYKNVNGTSTMILEASYNPSTHKYFKIRENNGTTYWEYSTDGITWTNFTNTATPFDVSKVKIGANAGTWSTETATSAIFDNFNVWGRPMTELGDDWSTGYVELTKWNNWGTSHVTVSNQQLAMTSTIGGGYYGFDASVNGRRFNLTNGNIVNQVVNAGNQSLESWEVYPIYASSAVDSSMAYYWFISGNTVKAYKKVSNVSTELASASYNSTNHKWFRIREAGGTTYFDYSADGATWTNFTSTVNAFTVTAMTAGSMIGTWKAELSTTTATLDNFNIMAPFYKYDANGNMISDGDKCYEYNDANQLKKVKSCSNSLTTAEYTYDYNGLRMIKKVYDSGTLKNTLTSWSDSFETNVIVSGATENTAYYWVNNELLAKKNPDGSKYYFQSDHLGSTSLLTNSGGGVIEDTKYDPWGEVKSGGTKSKFLYTGQEKDGETNLNYYNARYYNSSIRRFTQPDDIIQDPYSPQTLNRYSYVVNNPIRYTDPSGHYYESLLDIAFIGADLASISDDPSNLWNYAALAADVGGLIAPVGTGFGLCVRVVEHGGDVEKAVSVTKNAVTKANIIGNNRAIGRKAENIVEKELSIDKNNTFRMNETTTAHYRVPDFVKLDKVGNLKYVAEVKNVKTLRYTNQLKDIKKASQQSNVMPNLYIGNHTKYASKNQEKLIKQNFNVIRRGFK